MTSLRAAEPAFRVCAYLPEYRVGATPAESVEGLTDLILFSIEVNPDGSLNDRRWSPRHWESTQTVRLQPGLRTHICVGGWDRSSGFAEACASPEARKRLGSELVAFCQLHKLQGVDLDWEHPSSKADQSHFTTLLQELQPLLHAEGLELSIAVAPSQKLPGEAWAAVDHIMLMSYEDAGRHCTFESMQRHVGLLIQQGAPASKILLGLPFFGRKIKTREASSYADIVQKFAPRPEQDEVEDIYFNGPGLIAAKTAWSQTVGLGGVACWELGQDAPGEASLIRLIQSSLRQGESAPTPATAPLSIPSSR
ncbi:MAG: glycoside hydrolase family 18 protein [Planctomycetaceae bacterium]